MHVADETRDALIRYTVTLEDGTLISRNVGGDRLDYTRGEEQIFPALEAALKGATKGETRRFTLSPVDDPSLELDVTRLALSLGHPGETLILTVEIL